MTTLTVVADCDTRHLYRLLAAAAAAHGVETRAVDARRATARSTPPCRPGDALYRAAVDGSALEVEAMLWRPGVATLHRRPEGPLWGPISTAALFARHGVPAPRRVVCPTAAPDCVLALVDAVGGLPVVVRTEGTEGGRGVMVAESTRSVLSLVDHLVDQGFAPAIEELIEGTHWRIVVVGDSVAAAYVNPLRPGDFRSQAVDDACYYTTAPPTAAVSAAHQAVAALALDFGGVDVLVTPDGSAAVLEVNFPCYFAQAEDVAGIPVAAAMVAHLLAKAAHWTT
jgi:hypothetical protein